MLLRALLVLTFIAPWLMLAPTRSDACSCATIPTSERFAGATRVFSGVVTSTGGGGYGTIKFDVSNVWKGPNTSTITVYTGDTTVDCSGYPFEVGVEYLVFESEWRGFASVGTCSGTTPVEFAGSDVAELDALLEQQEDESDVEMQDSDEVSFPNSGSGGITGTAHPTSPPHGPVGAVLAISAIALAGIGVGLRRRRRGIN